MVKGNESERSDSSQESTRSAKVSNVGTSVSARYGGGSSSRNRTTSRYGSGPGSMMPNAKAGPANDGVEMSFPRRASIETAFGAHLPGTAIHNPSSCEERGVQAYTDGAVTHFASDSPSLHVAAHEAAHQLQHSGATRDAGMGAERHADELATAVTSGSSAKHLLGGSGEAVSATVHNYTEFTKSQQRAAGEWSAGSTAKIGDEGKTATTEYQHECYADPSLIKSANEILEAKKSGIRIKAGGAGIAGNAPDGSGWRSLSKVVPDILEDPADEEFYADCGRSSREVQGPSGTDTAPKGIYSDAAGDRTETSGSKDPATYRDDIYIAGGLGADATTARVAYRALAPADKEAFDKKHGINRHAAPGVGESFVARRDDDVSNEGFNWHWGGVIMVAGGDRVTFENFAKAGTDYDTKDKEWYFETYGPPSKAGQTFHDSNVHTVGEPGKNTTTMTAATSADPSSFTSAAAGMSTGKLIERYAATLDLGEKMALEAAMRKRTIKVKVKVLKTEDITGADHVYVKVTSGGKSSKTSQEKLNDGDMHTFDISLDKLSPVSGTIAVKVYDADWLDGDDMISIINWAAPFAERSDDRPWDGAHYETKVWFDK